MSPTILSCLHLFVLPTAAVFALATLATADAKHRLRAEWQFYATLVFAIGSATVTVARCDECWLIHTATVAVMIVGALSLPQRENDDRTRTDDIFDPTPKYAS